MRILHIRVAGVTYEGRQEYLSRLNVSDPVRLVPEPENRYDSNAIGVWVAKGDELLHCGYVPKELAAQIAPQLEGESLMVKIEAITGGFEFATGEFASLGLRLIIELPEAKDLTI